MYMSQGTDLALGKKELFVAEQHARQDFIGGADDTRFVATAVLDDGTSSLGQKYDEWIDVLGCNSCVCAPS